MGKRILGIIVIVISVIVLVVSLAGVVGTWVVRADVARVVGEVVTVADTALQKALDSADRVNNQLDQTRSTINTLNTTITTIGNKVQDNNVVLLAIDQIAGTSLAPTLDNLTKAANDLYDKAVAVDSKIETLNQIPLFNGGDGLLDKVSSVLDGVQQATQGLANFRQALNDAKSSATQSVVEVLTTPLTNIDKTLQSIQTAVGGVQNALSNVQASLTTFQSTVLFWLNLVAVLFTLLLLWIALSQYSLILHGWAMFKGRGKVEAPEMPTPAAATPMQATAAGGALPPDTQESTPVDASNPPEAITAPEQREAGQTGDTPEDLTN